MEINELTIGESFDRFEKINMVKLNPTTFHKYDINLIGFHYVYPENDKFTFLDNTVQKAGFKVKDNKVQELILFMDISDIDSFYQNMVDTYGEIGTCRISSEYMKRYGLENPSKADSTNLSEYYKKMPQPAITDYKLLNGVAWYDLKNSLQDGHLNTVLNVRNKLNTAEVNNDSYFVQVRFSIEDLKQ